MVSRAMRALLIWRHINEAPTKFFQRDAKRMECFPSNASFREPSRVLREFIDAEQLLFVGASFMWRHMKARLRSKSGALALMCSATESCGGEAGGRLVVAGTPEEVAACKESITGKYLRV